MKMGDDDKDNLIPKPNSNCEKDKSLAVPCAYWDYFQSLLLLLPILHFL